MELGDKPIKACGRTGLYGNMPSIPNMGCRKLPVRAVGICGENIGGNPGIRQGRRGFGSKGV